MNPKRLFRFAGASLALWHGLILFAGFFSPYDPTMQNRTLAFAPPTRIHFFDRYQRFHLRPFVYGVRAQPHNPEAYEEERSQVYPIKWMVRGHGYKAGGLFPTRWHLFGVDEPGRIFLFGSDDFGRDQFSRLLFGGQISIAAGLAATALSLGLGFLLGMMAGLQAGWLDEVVMRCAEVFMALPWLYLLFAVRAVMPLHVSAGKAFLLVVVVIGVLGWARPARLIRGVVLSAKEKDFVVAARGLGASGAYLVGRHVAPQTRGVMLTQASVLIPQYILAEVTLSFLGLGVSEPTASWGNMLSTLQQYHVLLSYWWMFIPGLALIPLIWGYYTLANTIKMRL
ncbi:MAG TPA: ABC transporter permease [Acidobacteriota bacterium]|jgi:peptide/nickel transport system permease protein